ncbi:hypothetical protein Tco_1085259 [Tanacetum coccineum]
MAMASTLESMAWNTSDIRYESTGVSTDQDSSPTESLMHDDSTINEQVQSSDDEDTRNDQKPEAGTRKDWWKPLPKEERPATPEPAWTILPFNVSDISFTFSFRCKSVTRYSQIRLTGRIRKEIKSELMLTDHYPSVVLQVMSLFKQNSSSTKICMPALSISKIKAARYPDFGLELLVPEQMCIEDVCTYDISANYGIAHWWFNQQKFYIDRHDSPSHRKEV